MQLGCLVCPVQSWYWWVLGRRSYEGTFFGGRSRWSGWHGFVMILRKSLSLAASHIALSVGELFLWKPTLTAFQRNDSSWSRWVAFVNPHHAEEEYWSFEMTVAYWNTVCSDWSSNPSLERKVHIMTGQMNWWRMRRALASRSCCRV